MSTQPDAIRLAEVLDLLWMDGQTPRQAAAELRRLHAFELALQEWLDKTQWVQDSCKTSELGMHRADIMSARIALLRAALRNLLRNKSDTTAVQDAMRALAATEFDK